MTLELDVLGLIGSLVLFVFAFVAAAITAGIVQDKWENAALTTPVFVTAMTGYTLALHWLFDTPWLGIW